MCLRHAGHINVRVQGKREKTKKAKKALFLKRALQINQQFQQQFAFRTL